MENGGTYVCRLGGFHWTLGGVFPLHGMIVALLYPWWYNTRQRVYASVTDLQGSSSKKEGDDEADSCRTEELSILR